MEITLTPDLEKDIADAVERARFINPAEAALEGLRLLKDQEEILNQNQELLRVLDERIAASNRGEAVPATDDFYEDIKRRGGSRLQVKL